MPFLTRSLILTGLLLALCVPTGARQQDAPPVAAQAFAYEKRELRIPMRDGVKLYTAVYVPKGKTNFPLLMTRTCYSSGPYGPGDGHDIIGGIAMYEKAGYGFVSQDVRGTYQSEGTFVNVRPQLKPGEKGIDESTDTYDTIEYLTKNVPGNNGRVGLVGVSYPGFYAAIGALSQHPALRAVSPQAPCADWFKGDDVHHNGAFFLQDNFDFSAWFDVPRKGLETDHEGIEVQGLEMPRPNGAYAFYLDAGTADGLEKKYFQNRSPYWKELIAHDTYDAYWKARAVPPQMKNVPCAVLNVGGWFDAEDMWGPLNTFAQTSKQSPKTDNFLVMGPWSHGQWEGKAQSLGGMDWGSDTAAWFQEHVEFPFFERYLRGKGTNAPVKATLFETGTNTWRTFAQWPPKTTRPLAIYLGDNETVSTTAPKRETGDTYINDPNAPTPYLADPTRARRPGDLLTHDEAWAAKRADVLTYVGAPQNKSVTVAGPVTVDLWAKTTGTDADFVVKVLDIAPAGQPHAGEMRMVRSDVIRARFRDSLEKPSALVPNQPTRIRFQLNDVLHTFLPGHQMAVQIQSSWFPLVDRNPNRFVQVQTAQPSDFQKADITILHGGAHASAIRFGVLDKTPAP